MEQMNYIARFLFDSAASCVMMIVRWMVHVWHTTVIYVSTILRNLITWYATWHNTFEKVYQEPYSIGIDLSSSDGSEYVRNKML